MKKISLIIFLLIMPFSYVIASQEKDDAYVAEFEKLAKKYSNNGVSLKSKHALQVCADKGNYYCSAWLGHIFFAEKNYTGAISNLKKCSGEYDGECDFELGIIYQDGLGILQSDDKAISYYKKAANLGHSEAAYNLSVIYVKKASNVSNGKYSEEKAKQMSNDVILSYAWLKVAMALGQENCYSKTDESLPIAKFFGVMKDGLTSDGLLKQGDNMATQICSKNKFCKE